MQQRTWSGLLSLALWVGVTYGATSDCDRVVDGDIYQFDLTEIDEVTPLPLESLRGKVAVIFNSATY